VFPRRRVVWALGSTVILCGGGAAARGWSTGERAAAYLTEGPGGVVGLFRLLGYT
jgi:hypothetical protein